MKVRVMKNSFIVCALLIAVISSASVFAADVVAKGGTIKIENDTYLKAKNAAGTGTVDLIKANTSDVAVIPDGSELATSAAPTADADIANKKYVDDRGFVDRGDPSGYDYDVNDLTADNTWRDLDLSSIVPAGAKAVLLLVVVNNTAINETISFRKNGNTNIYAMGLARVYIGTTSNFYYNLVIPCDADRKIEYYGGNVAGTWNRIDIVVMGWWY